MSKIPRPLLVALVLILGSLAVYFGQTPHTACDSQRDLFMETQKGYLFAREGKGVDHAPQYKKFLEMCKLGGTYSACFEYFSLIRRTLRDLEAAPENCSEQFQEVPELRRALEDSLEIFVVLAWGAQPPEPGSDVVGPLQSADLALFCRVKKNYLQMFGEEQFASLRTRIQGVLPGEPLRMDSHGDCDNCSTRKLAPDVFSPDQIWSRSIFSVRCEKYF